MTTFKTLPNDLCGKFAAGKIILLTMFILSGCSQWLFAAEKPVIKNEHVLRTGLNKVRHTPSALKTDKNGKTPATENSVAAAPPTLSYASPQVYKAGIAITPLTPTGGSVAAPAYATTTTTLGSGFNIPAGLAVDSKGNVFVGDQNNNDVKEIPGGTGTPIVIASGFSTPDGVAVDAQDNVYVANDGGNLVQGYPSLMACMVHPSP